MNITWKGSPNFTKGRSVPTDRVVIHWFGVGTLESANTRFQNPNSQVSAHYGVSGDRVWQWVKEEDVAYQAGNWTMNKRSIGIEHDATLEHNLSEQDYQLTGQLVAEACKRHNIPLDREHIIGHKQIKPTQCPGTIDIDKIISIAQTYMQTNLKVQVVFNTRYNNEATALAEAKTRMEALSEGKVTFTYFPSLYTEHTNIPSRIFMDGMGQQDMAVEYDWFIKNVYLLNKEADVVIFVGKDGDWQNEANGFKTFGHYYSTEPTTFPALIQIVAGENDWSWKWPALPAFKHYLTHEISHALFQAQGTDKTHELDYASVDGLKQGLPYLDFNAINYRLTHKVSYERTPAVFIKKDNDGTIYLNEADVLVPFSASYENFLADFPNAKVITVSPNEFLKFRTANKVVIKDR